MIKKNSRVLVYFVNGQKASVDQMLIGWEPFLDWHTQHPVGLGDAQANVPDHIPTKLSPVVLLVHTSIKTSNVLAECPKGFIFVQFFERILNSLTSKTFAFCITKPVYHRNRPFLVNKC